MVKSMGTPTVREKKLAMKRKQETCMTLKAKKVLRSVKYTKRASAKHNVEQLRKRKLGMLVLQLMP